MGLDAALRGQVLDPGPGPTRFLGYAPGGGYSAAALENIAAPTFFAGLAAQTGISVTTHMGSVAKYATLIKSELRAARPVAVGPHVYDNKGNIRLIDHAVLITGWDESSQAFRINDPESGGISHLPYGDLSQHQKWASARTFEVMTYRRMIGYSRWLRLVDDLPRSTSQAPRRAER